MTPADDLRSIELFCSLYGVRWFHLRSGSHSHVDWVLPVLFADRSWFSSHPEIAGVVIETMGRIGLRVNLLSPSIEALKSSLLYRTLEPCGAIFDLRNLESRFGFPELTVLSPETVECGEDAVLKELREKHGVVAEPYSERGSCTVVEGSSWGGYPSVFGADFLTCRIQLEVAGITRRKATPSL